MMHTNSSSITATIDSILPLSTKLQADAHNHLDNLTKPQGSLGKLEDLSAQLYAIQEKTPLRTDPALMITVAGDHGIVAQGVASTPQEVTIQMVYNFLQGGAGINALCKSVGADLLVVDAGVANHIFPAHPLLINAKIGNGTADMSKDPAMSAKDCTSALELGISLANTTKDKGYTILGIGEMGIGNTTPSSALLCAYLGFSAEEMTGMGAGVPPAGLQHKTNVINIILQRHESVIASADPMSILAAMGGYEIATMAGIIIGAAARRLPVVIDGFIATASYTAAWKMAPLVAEYCIFGHGSAESGHTKALRALGQKPLLDLGLRLGEGTGAALAFGLIKAAATVYNDMATFASAGIKLP